MFPGENPDCCNFRQVHQSFATHRIWHGGQCQSGLWLGGNKVNYSACKWYEATSAHFIGGRSGGSIYYKPIQCPAGYVMTGTRMYGIGDGVDEEHVDAYCCPFG